MIGFTYDGTHSSTYGIVAKSTNRSMLPTMVSRTLFIPGKNGMYDFGDNTYDQRNLVVQLQYVGSDFENLRTQARSIAYWLNGRSGYKQIIFDDEDDKYYLCKIYSEIALSNIFRLGECEAQFLCNPPFAISTTLRTTTANVTASGQVITVSSSGTADTPSIFYLYNYGTSAISTLSITRETLV